MEGATMGVTLYSRTMSLKRAALAILLIGTLIVSSSAEAQTVGFPDNARKSRYSEGWECVRGFKRVEDRCVKIVMPKNAFATGSSFGRSWVVPTRIH